MNITLFLLPEVGGRREVDVNIRRCVAVGPVVVILLLGVMAEVMVIKNQQLRQIINKVTCRTWSDFERTCVKKRST